MYLYADLVFGSQDYARYYDTVLVVSIFLSPNTDSQLTNALAAQNNSKLFIFSSTHLNQQFHLYYTRNCQQRR